MTAKDQAYARVMKAFRAACEYEGLNPAAVFYSAKGPSFRDDNPHVPSYHQAWQEYEATPDDSEEVED